MNATNLFFGIYCSESSESNLTLNVKFPVNAVKNRIGLAYKI